ncbi:hypothetical protein [Arundinibacter roseus]|uniref:Outer membrane protein beta-barrel domain-containing protein n=1 Tax=Arundinibacter roseus TaxID=2070510 RepID=A0A4R4K958_9BACT|nr:hypothetical protein [Arundinibacter roseus]TDB64210.1 hypothetical protein EZE20_14855 [Arundinibacter roseus]
MRLNFCLKALCLTLCLPLLTQAQEKNAVSFSGGYSLPLGKFASEQFSDPEAGLAGSGIFAQLRYEHKIGRWWGLRLSGNLNINQTNPDPLIEQYSILLPDPETYSWESTVTQWRLGAILAGPMAYVSLGNIELKGHVQAGYVFAKSPGVTLMGTSTTGLNSVDAGLPGASTQAFGYGAGGALRFRLSEHLRFQITGDWIGANTELKDVPTYVKLGDRPPFEGFIDSKRFVTVLNVGLGLVVVF